LNAENTSSISVHCQRSYWSLVFISKPLDKAIIFLSVTRYGTINVLTKHMLNQDMPRPMVYDPAISAYGKVVVRPNDFPRIFNHLIDVPHIEFCCSYSTQDSDGSCLLWLRQPSRLGERAISTTDLLHPRSALPDIMWMPRALPIQLTARGCDVRFNRGLIFLSKGRLPLSAKSYVLSKPTQ
jgi:hypothetical protein